MELPSMYNRNRENPQENLQLSQSYDTSFLDLKWEVPESETEEHEAMINSWHQNFEDYGVDIKDEFALMDIQGQAYESVTETNSPDISFNETEQQKTQITPGIGDQSVGYSNFNQLDLGFSSVHVYNHKMQITKQATALDDFNKKTESEMRIIDVRKLPLNELRPIHFPESPSPTPPAPRLWVKNMTELIQPNLIQHTVPTASLVPQFNENPKPISIKSYNPYHLKNKAPAKVHPSAQVKNIQIEKLPENKLLNKTQLIEVYPSAFGVKRHYEINKTYTDEYMLPPLPSKRPLLEEPPKEVTSQKTNSPPSKVKIIPADMAKLKQLMEKAEKQRSTTYNSSSTATAGQYKTITINNPRVLYSVPPKLAKMILSKKISFAIFAPKKKAVSGEEPLSINRTTTAAAVPVKIEESVKQSEEIDFSTAAGSAADHAVDAATLVTMKSDVIEQDENLPTGELNQPLSVIEEIATTKEPNDKFILPIQQINCKEDSASSTTKNFGNLEIRRSPRNKWALKTQKQREANRQKLVDAINDSKIFEEMLVKHILLLKNEEFAENFYKTVIREAHILAKASQRKNYVTTFQMCCHIAKRYPALKLKASEVKLFKMNSDPRTAGRRKSWTLPKETLKIAPTTLQHKHEENVYANGDIKRRGRPFVYLAEFEPELLNEIRKWDINALTFSFSDKVRGLAFELAANKRMKHSFNIVEKMASTEWYNGFLRKYPEIKSIANFAAYAQRHLSLSASNKSHDRNTVDTEEQPHRERKQNVAEMIITKVNKIENIVTATIIDQEANQIKHENTIQSPKLSGNRRITRNLSSSPTKKSIEQDSVPKVEVAATPKPKVHLKSNTNHLSLYQCHHCDMRFMEKRKLATHLRAHFLIKYRCTLCHDYFPALGHLQKHSVVCGFEENKHVCTMCESSFKKRASLRRHIFAHIKNKQNIDGQFKCHICQKCYLRKDLLSTHLRLLHNAKNVYQCHHCPKTSTFKQHMFKHLMSQHFKDTVNMPAITATTGIRQKFKCAQCGRQLNTSQGLRNHKRTHSMDENKFKCNICPANFARPDGLKRHAKIHIKQKRNVLNATFKCWVCGLCSRTYEHHKTHIMDTHSELWKKRCPRCSFFFKNKQSWFHHMPRHGRWLECEQCKHIFSNTFLLQAHIKKRHTGDYVCHHCNLSFSTKQRMQIHLVRACTVVMNPDRVKFYECAGCEKGFSSHAHLENHLFSIHLNAQVVPLFECHYCSKSFKHKSNLIRHFHKTHETYVTYVTGVHKQHECLECGKELRSSRNLVNHKRTHLKVPNKYKCSICSAAFARSAGLRRHAEVHITEKSIVPNESFNCWVCGLYCKNREHQKTHIEDKHSELWKKRCPRCSFFFTSKQSWFRHMARHGRWLECEQCKQIFSNSIRLQEHIRIWHRDDYECHHCKCKCTSKHRMQIHLERKCAVLDRVESFVCEPCGKGFSSHNSLQRHLKSMHLKVCHYCAGEFKHKSNLIRHFRQKHELYNNKKTDKK